MSPVRAGPELRKVTLNLNEADCAFAEKYFGQGWTTHLREVWHQHCQNYNRIGQSPRTLGDLADDH